MIKFVTHTMDSVDNVQYYSIISLTLFITIFVVFFIWAMTYKKSTIKELSELPFNED